MSPFTVVHAVDRHVPKGHSAHIAGLLVASAALTVAFLAAVAHLVAMFG